MKVGRRIPQISTMAKPFDELFSGQGTREVCVDEILVGRVQGLYVYVPHAAEKRLYCVLAKSWCAMGVSYDIDDTDSVHLSSP